MCICLKFERLHDMEYILIGMMALIILAGASAYFVNLKINALEEAMLFNRQRIIEELGEEQSDIADGVSNLLQLVLRLDPNVVDLPTEEE